MRAKAEAKSQDQALFRGGKAGPRFPRLVAF